MTRYTFVVLQMKHMFTSIGEIEVISYLESHLIFMLRLDIAWKFSKQYDNITKYTLRCLFDTLFYTLTGLVMLSQYFF